MIKIKTPSELETMNHAGKICAHALKLAGEAVRPGVTTKEIDNIVFKYITSQGGAPSFLGYNGFPFSACISVNNEVIHGMPSSRILNKGDIISVDVGVCYNGFHGDSAATFAVGEISKEAKDLIKVTKQCLVKAIEIAGPTARVGDISNAIQTHAESHGYSVVRQYVGHGVGRDLHEPPDIPNAGKSGHGLRLSTGMTIAIEPMVNIDGEETDVLPDGWTVITRTGCLSAHFEHTIKITDTGSEVLTAL